MDDEAAAQRLPRPKEAALDRGFRHRQKGGDTLQRPLLNIVQIQRLAVIGAEFVECCPQRVAFGGAQRVSFGVAACVRGIRVRETRQGFGFGRLHPLLALSDAQRPKTGDGANPRAEARRGIETGERPEGDHEGVLRDLLGDGATADDRLCADGRRAAVATDEFVECREIGDER